MLTGDENYRDIAPTAIMTAYPRIFTDIPYEKEIYEWLRKNRKEKVVLNKLLAPEIEARYKLTNRILDQSGIKQVLELAAGYSSRGIVYSQKGYNYVEMDLDGVIFDKRKIVHEIMHEVPKVLNIVNGNALRKEDFDKVDGYFDRRKPVAVINEGLLRYLTFDEKRIVARNVYDFLKTHGGIWITCDVTPKKFIQSQERAIPNFNKELNNVIARNNINDRFEDIEHVKNFFGEIGLEVVEVHKFNKMKNELYSINVNGIKIEKIDKVLGDAITVVMKVKESNER